MERDGLTRRQFAGTGLGVAASAVLGGCTGDGSVGVTQTGTPTAEEPATGETATATPTDSAYAVSMSPVGEVTFESPPERVFTVLSHHADMALSLGRGDDLTGVYAVEYTNSLMNAFTPRLPGVSVDWSDLYSSWNPSKEKLIELDSDVHLADPANVLTMNSWEQSDVREVERQVAPWFGNTFSAQHGDPPAAYADGYEYYTLWEQFGKVAQVLRRTDRFDVLRTQRDDLHSTIRDGLPPESERPTVAMVLHSTNGDGMWVYDVNADGTHSSHTRPLGAVDAFADDDGVPNGGKVDYEALAAADPDVILTLGGLVEAHDMTAIRAALEDDPVASDVTAVQEGRVFAQGTRHQGPLVNLFQLEMTAKQLYPDQFGEWPQYAEGPYPEIPEGERLFDRERVADAVTDG